MNGLDRLGCEWVEESEVLIWGEYTCVVRKRVCRFWFRWRVIGRKMWWFRVVGIWWLRIVGGGMWDWFWFWMYGWVGSFDEDLRFWVWMEVI